MNVIYVWDFGEFSSIVTSHHARETVAASTKLQTKQNQSCKPQRYFFVLFPFLFVTIRKLKKLNQNQSKMSDLPSGTILPIREQAPKRNQFPVLDWQNKIPGSDNPKNPFNKEGFFKFFFSPVLISKLLIFFFKQAIWWYLWFIIITIVMTLFFGAVALIGLGFWLETKEK